MIRRLWLCQVGLLSATLTSGCATDPTEGYSAVSPFPSGISTVCVEIFKNNTFDREVEFELADAIIKQIEARTPYKVTPPARADTILTSLRR